LKLSTVVLARILRQFCISESYILDLATFCCFFFWQKKQTSDFLSLVEQTFCLYVLQIRVNSTKSMTGHLLGAAGGIEAVAAIQVRRLM